jgi:hypothetical protein
MIIAVASETGFPLCSCWKFYVASRPGFFFLPKQILLKGSVPIMAPKLPYYQRVLLKASNKVRKRIGILD